MSVIATTAAASALVTTATQVIQKGRETRDQLRSEADNLRDLNSNSLTQYTRATQLISRLYIGEDIYNEPVLPGVVRVLRTTYVGLILTALQLNRVVTGGKTVREMLGVVATEALSLGYRDIMAEFEQNRPRAYVRLIPATEDASHLDPTGRSRPAGNSQPKSGSAGKGGTNAPHHLNPTGQRDPHGQPGQKAVPAGAKDDKPKGDGVGSAIANAKGTMEAIRQADDGVVPGACVIEVTFTSPENSAVQIKLPLMVQLMPYIVPTPVVAQLIGRDASLSRQQRWLQVKAGEIQFWRDFIFQYDVARRRADAVRNDKSGVLADFAAMQSKKSGKQALSYLDEKNARSRNIANNIMLFSERSLREVKMATGFDLHKASDRARYFADTYAMIIGIIDPMYNRVTLYYNGIEEGGTFSYEQFKPAAKGGGGGDAMDLVRAMTMLQQGQVPRF